ncbi:hypothetical protein [Vagococcus acidifermentans]|uniref:hypothetical protein n=1 Tax=Vagococcus acidifermentans TaxID=564710 RepID=UPI001476C894|nr:hypothetical protein [Vagococcus acidifermentans]
MMDMNAFIWFHVGAIVAELIFMGYKKAKKQKELSKVDIAILCLFIGSLGAVLGYNFL